MAEVLQEWETSKGKKVQYVGPADDMEIAESAVKVVGPPNIWVLPRLRPDSPVVCHILNRNYDEEKGSVAPARDVRVVLGAPLIDGKISSCKLISPDGSSIQLNAKLIDDGLHITIPELGMWSLLIAD